MAADPAVKETMSKMSTMNDRSVHPAAACRAWSGWLGGLMLLMFLLLHAGAASADPMWSISSRHGAQVMVPGEVGQYVIQVYNDGTTDSDGTTITMTDTLPAGVVATNASSPFDFFNGGAWVCDGVGTGTLTCTLDGVLPAPGLNIFQRGLAPAIMITVDVAPGASGTLDNTATVSGGGAVAAATFVDATPFGSTPAGFGFVADTFESGMFDGLGAGAPVVRQAGAHPFEARFDFDMNLRFVDDPLRGGQFTEPDEQLRNVEVRLPRGLIGNPEAMPKCSAHQLLLVVNNYGAQCPPDTQVGTVALVLNNGNEVPNANNARSVPVYDMEPPLGSVAAFAFVVSGQPVWITATLDPSDYSIVTRIHDATALLPVRSVRMRLWGVPASSAHDALRFDPTDETAFATYGIASTAPVAPFLTLPSQCTTAGTITLTADSWKHPDVFASASSSAATLTGCESQQFSASIDIAPTTLKPSGPSGLVFDLAIPQDLTPSGLGTPPLKKAVVHLPEGMTVSPSSADGLGACTSLQIKLGTNDEPTCPAASRIGSVELTTPLLPDPVDGAVYLAAQDDNPFGSLLALYLVIQDKDRSLLIKLPGKIEPDATTGRITATFDNNPQVPFSKLHLKFKSGPRAPLSTPATCGVKTTTAELTSWNESLPVVQATSTFTISKDGAGAPCGERGFDPVLKAGTTNPVAGADSPLRTTMTRKDGDQEFGAVDVSLPTGVLGRISSVDLCSNGAANAGTCGEGSRIGTVTVAAGPGTNPFYITDGKVFITDGYKGAPFGLSIAVHAKAGPLDLGNVIVRARVQVDRRTAALRIVTDPLPTILAGIPLQLRLANVTVDRPGFMFNPTNCAVKHITGTISSSSGDKKPVSTRFRVAGCSALPFHPRMSIRVGGKGHTRPGSSTPLVATLRMTKGQASLRGVRVALPTTLNALIPVVDRACTLAEFEAGDCAGARAGTAVAVTPLLRQPLRGGMFFVKNGRPLPDLMVALRGQVDIDLVGKVTISDGDRLSADFDNVPDVPISRFTLSLVSGRNGPVGVANNLCTPKSKRAKVRIAFRSQSGELIRRSQPLRIAGCGKRNAAKTRGSGQGFALSSGA